MDAPSPLARIFQRQRAAGFPSLAGARLSGTLPIPTEWINASLRENRPKSNSILQGIALALPGGNRGVLLLQVEKWPLPRQWEVPFLWDPVVAVPEDPVLRLTLQPAGLLASALPFLGALPMPQGVRIDGRYASINLATLMKSGGMGDLVPLVTRLNVNARPGALILDFDIAVPSGGETTR